jgi:hypothetical protein
VATAAFTLPGGQLRLAQPDHGSKRHKADTSSRFVKSRGVIIGLSSNPTFPEREEYLNVKSKFARLIMALALVFGALGLAHVTTQSASAACTYYITWYENENHGGDSRTFCYSDGVSVGWADLNNISHTQAGTCASAALFRIGDDWDDCISSVGILLPTNRCVVFFNDTSGNGPIVKARQGTGSLFYSNMSQAGVDKTTSIYFGSDSGSTCHTFGGNQGYYSEPQDQ